MTNLCIMSPYVLVPALRSILGMLKLNDPDRRLKYYKEEGLVAVPVKTADIADNIKDALRGKIDVNQLEIKSVNLPRAKRLNVKSPQIILRERLKQLVIESGQEWTEEVSKDIPVHWEVHGDLVLIPDIVLILPIWNVIGQTVWKTVVESLSCQRLARKSKVSIDGYRTPQVHLLLGDDGWVEHTDNGIRYTYDVTKCMFSIGNISEKLRVASFNCKDEIVVDLYAGIGYFTLPYLVHTGVKHLHACEWNLDAVEALRRNLIVNGVQDRCSVYPGDNRELCLKGIADRVNLGLIPSSREGWPVACAALKPGTGGMLHIHYNVNTKPRTGNQNEVNRENWQPAEVFRCEGKCKNSRPGENARTDKCEISGTYKCEVSRTDVCENSRTDKCESSRTDKHDISRPDKCEHSRTDKCENSRTDKCELSRTDKCENSRTDICESSRTDKCENSRTDKCQRSRTDKHDISRPDKCEHSTTDKCENSRTDKCELLRTEGCDNHGHRLFTFAPDGSLDKQTKHVRNNVELSKWYAWAKSTSNEVRDILHDVHNSEWTTRIVHIEHVKSYAPYVDHVVLDLDCRPRT